MKVGRALGSMVWNSETVFAVFVRVDCGVY
jgi:hypothetical protein